MKLSRRNAIGALVGGAVAGPEAAKEAMKGVSAYPPAYPSSFGYTGEQTNTIRYDPAEDINRLNKTINGEFSEYQLEDIEDSKQQYRNRMQDENLDALKSTSRAFRVTVQNDRYITNKKQRIIDHAKKELKKLSGLFK